MERGKEDLLGNEPAEFGEGDAAGGKPRQEILREAPGAGELPAKRRLRVLAIQQDATHTEFGCMMPEPHGTRRGTRPMRSTIGCPGRRKRSLVT